MIDAAAPKIKRSRRRLYENPETQSIESSVVTTASTVDPPKSGNPVPKKTNESPQNQADADDPALSAEDLVCFEAHEKVVLLEHTRRRIRCDQIILENVFWVAAVGFIPIPVVDVAAVTTVQLKMINELSLEYRVQFSRHRSRAILISLAGGVGTTALSWLKLLPGHGSLIGGINFGLMGGVITYAVGKIFIEHFESGGNLDNFDPEKVRTRFNDLMVEGRQKLRSELAR